MSTTLPYDPSVSEITIPISVACIVVNSQLKHEPGIPPASDVIDWVHVDDALPDVYRAENDRIVSDHVWCFSPEYTHLWVSWHDMLVMNNGILRDFGLGDKEVPDGDDLKVIQPTHWCNYNSIRGLT